MTKTCTEIRRCLFTLSLLLLGGLVVVDPLWAQGELSFVRTDFTVEGGPFSVIVGDFNGDGHPDLATTTIDTNTVSILLGQGDGTFQSGQVAGVGELPASIVVGDFNEDGHPDLATANQLDIIVSILPGVGDGTFQSAQSVGVGAGPVSIVVGEFNGDGHQDLATANEAFTVSILLGQGDGTFQSAQSVELGKDPESIVVGEFNGDGHQDLAVATASATMADTVSVLLGQGDGTFQPPQHIGIGAVPSSITVGDFNGDGQQDLATANAAFNANTVSILLGQGDGTFQAPQAFGVGATPTFVVVGDFNGDGHQDLVTANIGVSSVSILLGRGDGTFQPAQHLTVGERPFSVAVRDFDGNGQQDLATANRDTNTVSILINTTAVEIAVKIDIKPGSLPNSINPKSNGVIPIAILTTDTFDATTVDSTTVRFGATGTEAGPVHATLDDVNTDGLADLLLHFRTQNTGIVCGSTSSSLTGKTFGGQSIQGSDSVRTVGCK
jgi:hypothetical protein